MTTGLVGQNQIAPFTSPIPGGSLDATVVLGNDNSTVSSYDAHDNDSTIHFQSSTLANRPPASTAGQKWLTTDAAARYIYYDTGSAWVEVDYFRDSGGIITGAVTISDTTESTSTTTGALIVSGGVGIAKNVFIGGTLGVTGVATFTAQPIVSSLTASKPVFTDASKGLVSTGTLGTDQGGTNLTSYTTGDILYASATNVLSKLPIGTTGQHLIVSGGIPSWSTDSALGTVTSVSWTGGLVSVATATTTPALTVAGTSGGIVYFSSASTWASSAALTQYGVVYGGGAGATPVATAAGTTGQVLTATTSGAPTWSATYAGTVTSVGFTGGLISVATATTTPALTVAGTSGGVVYFSSASTWASSAALTANAIVLGGGAGAAPATTTTGTGVVTALGVNVGTAGAFVVNGGALGTPSSGAVAASLITAGTFGAGAYTFPGALAITGAFTGATTGAFSGLVAIGGASSVTPYTALLTVKGSGGTFFVRDSGGEAYFYGAATPYYFGTAYAGSSLVITSGNGTTALTLSSTQAATFSNSLAINGAFTGATTGAFSTSAAIPITGVRTDAAGVLGVFEVKRSATTIGYIGMDASDNFALISGAGAVVGLKMSSAGLITIPGAATFSSTLGVTGASTLTGNVGVGAAPLSAVANFSKLNVGSNMSMFANSGVGSVGLLMQNANYDGTNYVRINTDLASRYYQALGVQTFSHAVTGTAGSTIAWVDDFVISATGAATFSSTLAVTGTLSGTGTNTWNLQSVGVAGDLVAGGWLYGVNEGINITPNGAGLLKRLVLGYYNGGAYKEAIGYSNVASGNTTVSILSGGGTLSVGAAATFSSTITAATVYTTTVGATNRDLYIDNTGLMGYVSSLRP